jgi:hypothetical protein
MRITVRDDQLQQLLVEGAVQTSNFMSLANGIASTALPQIGKETAMSERSEFSVVEFFAEGTHHYVERRLRSREALMLARHCICKYETKSGHINRIIITDGGDFTVFEWEKGKGITWPEESDQ